MSPEYRWCVQSIVYLCCELNDRSNCSANFTGYTGLVVDIMVFPRVCIENPWEA